MARATVNRKVSVGTKIEGNHETFEVFTVKKHAYRVKSENGKASFDLWSWEVHLNHLGQFCADK